MLQTPGFEVGPQTNSRFLIIPRLKGSSVSRANVPKMVSKAKKAATIVSYCKINASFRSGKVISSQWYRLNTLEFITKSFILALLKL